MKNLNPRFLYLLPLLLTVTLIVFGEALGDLWKEDVKAVFQQNKWLLLAFVLLLALVGFLWERQQRSEKPIAEEVDKDQYEEAFVQFRKNLLEQYQTRLNSKTGRRLPVNLTAKPTNFGTSPERIEAYFKDLTIESDDIASEISHILDTHRRLLLIGEPGAGKTTILLYAAINILNDARESKLPLLLNLATWGGARDFVEWYVQSVAHTYSLSPVFVQELLRRNAVVPFFDGFDEVAEQYRDDCFQKMAAYFGDEKRKQLIVSSRKKEYAAAEADAPVYAEIEVQPLSLAQIKKALSENAHSQAADRALLHALDRDKWLAGAVETPFYLNTASFLFGKGQRTLADFPFKARSTKGRQSELVKIFVAEQVPERRDRKYLHFLAGKMEQENFLVFELVSMQPRWCRDSRRYRLIVYILVTLVGGLCFGLPLGLVFSLIFGISGGMFKGVISGSILGLILNWASNYSEIRTKDIKIRHWKTFPKDWGLQLGVSCCIFSCVFGLFFGLFFGWNVGLIFGLSFGLVLGLFGTLEDVTTKTIFLLHITTPYHRFWATFRNAFWEIPAFVLAVIFGSLAVVIWGEKFSWGDLLIWRQNIGFWLMFFPLCLLLFLIPFDYYFFGHFSLRLVLYLEGKMPLRVVTFMDRMSEQYIFEDNRRTNKKGKKMRGATWRFRHKILQDYFAGHPA